MTFAELDLSPALCRRLAHLGYDRPTPVQVRAIPPVLDGADLLAGAPTGTGKTAAFALPMIELLCLDAEPVKLQPKRPPALVLTPTRELAAQVHEAFLAYGRDLGLRSVAIFGGVGMAPQVQALQRGVTVVVATPGRLLDHVEQRTIDLSQVEMLVLDEADRMLDMGFAPALRRILAQLPKDRQTLLFSATLGQEIQDLARRFMHDPVEVQVAAPNGVARTVNHRVHPVDPQRKRELLLHLLRAERRQQTLVFCRTKRGSDRLARQLGKEGLRVSAIHGNKSQGQRTKALADFKARRVDVLVATDIAARGLDIEQLPLVINFELPMVAEDYVHRIGRTGRAGSTGHATSLVAPDERDRLREIQALLEHEIEVETVPGFEPQVPLRLLEGGAARPAARNASPRPQRGPRPARQGQRPKRRPAGRDGLVRVAGAPSTEGGASSHRQENRPPTKAHRRRARTRAPRSARR